MSDTFGVFGVIIVGNLVEVWGDIFGLGMGGENSGETSDDGARKSGEDSEHGYSHDANKNDL